MDVHRFGAPNAEMASVPRARWALRWRPYMVKKLPPILMPTDMDYIYRPWITLRDGRRIYAKDRGLIAFKIPRRY